MDVHADPTDDGGVGARVGVAPILEGVVTTAGPDPGFRSLLRLLTAYDIPVSGAPRTPHQALAERLGRSQDHLEDRLPDPGEQD
ncbi:hypothetical protein GCM10010275_19870 [Streptomyces litmocidini]|uniref:hypothetical protein n=1 Tax=Streptomyces litmocidini TaxID=67318 RepID=UPI00167E709D|nr:hypothetical protein [Streptomyces litmocidini]GGU84795.1 hypothetical protein GCM10010275_19870 [Streptomyces litmocidini]